MPTYLSPDEVPFPSPGGIPTPKLRPSTPEELAVARANGTPTDMPWTTDPKTGLPAAYPPASRAQRRARRREYTEETGRALHDAMRSLVLVCGGEKEAARWIKSVDPRELQVEFDDGLPAPRKSDKHALLIEIRRQRRILDAIPKMADADVPGMPVWDFRWTPRQAPAKPGPNYFPAIG
jgi:hypothetical protein